MTYSPDCLLHMFRITVLSEVRSDQQDLKLRQLGVLLTVYGDDELQTVRSLAKHLNIRKPAVTKALDRLSEFSLARRKIDVLDRRSVLIMRTSAGTAMMQRLMDAMATASSGR